MLIALVVPPHRLEKCNAMFITDCLRYVRILNLVGIFSSQCLNMMALRADQRRIDLLAVLLLLASLLLGGGRGLRRRAATRVELCRLCMRAIGLRFSSSAELPFCRGAIERLPAPPGTPSI